MKKHTPGPWWYDFARETGDGPGFTIFGPNTAAVADVSADREGGVTGATVEANARLIAAAPDLLDAALNYLDGDDCRIDHQGFCQAHGLSKPCRQQTLRRAVRIAQGLKP
jgi:hypothetical protein